MDINQPLNRRCAFQLAAASLLVTTTGARALQPRPSFTTTTRALADLERRTGGRLGVGLLDTASGQTTGHRQGERFAMCSTFKMPLAAAILREIDQGRLRADQWVAYGKADMVAHAPVTTQHLERGGMAVAALAEAAQTTSDNPAANLLLKLIGGPAGFTAILRTTGDTTTRLDRFEPQLNHVTGQDMRDTTTPSAMARTTAHLLTSDWLSATSRDTLAAWMVATTTGKKRIRAGLPSEWRAGDKTGTASAPHMRDKYNDVAITWPPGKAPLVITAFLETRGSHPNIREEDQAVLAEVGRIATAWSRSL
ncbi:MAG: class A beta-lactamase [Pseudomonadota bacterium]